MNKRKRVIAVHDLSCVGRCSLTVALPVISAAGMECSALPTAVLSTHTGGFKGYTCLDLTGEITPILNHWAALDLSIDAVYSGYLASKEQVRLVEGLFDSAKAKGARLIVDPVMADDGRLYPSFGPDFPAGMRELCRKADLILPNITEAALLLEQPYVPGPHSREQVERWLHDLSALGPQQVVLTGVQAEGQIGAAVYDRKEGAMQLFMRPCIDGFYHGTGDLFASALTGALLAGGSLSQATEIAVDYTVDSIRRTREAGGDSRYGVDFEVGMGEYARRVSAL